MKSKTLQVHTELSLNSDLIELGILNGYKLLYTYHE